MSTNLNTVPETEPDYSIQDCREQIDALDDEIIALLKRRISIVEKVGALKKAEGQKGLFIRSGREGFMIARIFGAFKDSTFSSVAAATMWRQIIGASVHVESKLQISVMHTAELPGLLWLAREYFGAFIPMTQATAANRVISDCVKEKANVGVLPYPGDSRIEDDSALWWQQLMAQGNTSLKIFAYMPTVITPEFPRNMPHALAIGDLEPEESGNDESYFAFALGDTVSTSRMHDLFAKSGINANVIRSSAQPGARHMLVKTDGFYTDLCPELEKVLAALGDAQVVWLGSHPKPIQA